MVYIFLFFIELRDKMIKMGKDDLKGRHNPLYYAIWATHYTNYQSRIITMPKSHHSSEPCEDQHQYICQRPAAALEGSEALGK